MNECCKKWLKPDVMGIHRSNRVINYFNKVSFCCECGSPLTLKASALKTREALKGKEFLVGCGQPELPKEIYRTTRYSYHINQIIRYLKVKEK